MWLLIGLVGLPLVEIALFIVIGGLIGVGATLLWVVATALAGVAVMRTTGHRTLQALQAAMAGVQDPAVPIADGALRFAGGMLLALPGFLTDALGLVLLVPAVRRILIRTLARRRRRGAAPVVIEAEYRDVTPPPPPTDLRRR
jgi:UPF0716 protein FxsA